MIGVLYLVKYNQNLEKSIALAQYIEQTIKECWEL